MTDARQGATVVEPGMTYLSLHPTQRFRFLAGAGLTAGLLLWAYWPVLPGLIAQWWNEPDYSHGFLVPIISGAVVWARRSELARTPVHSYGPGLAVLAAALVFYLAGSVGADLFLQRVSMILALGGAILYAAGTDIFQRLIFPLGFLLLAIPLPGIVFQSIAFPLQLLASEMAAWALQLLQVPVFREGNIIHLASLSLDVEEACSGIRSLLSLTALGILFAYLGRGGWKARSLIVASVFPIAILANAARVASTGLIAHHVSPRAAEGFFHGAGGMLIFLVALSLLFGVTALAGRRRSS